MKKNNSRAKSKSSPAPAAVAPEVKSGAVTDEAAASPADAQIKPHATATPPAQPDTKPDVKAETTDAQPEAQVDAPADPKAKVEETAAQKAETAAPEEPEAKKEEAKGQEEAPSAAPSAATDQAPAAAEEQAAPGAEQAPDAQADDKSEAAQSEPDQADAAQADAAQAQATTAAAPDTNDLTKTPAKSAGSEESPKLAPKIRKLTATKKKEAKSLATTEDTPIAEAFKARIIVVTSGKGGVGKTTSAAAISTGLALKGHKTAVIDFDVGLRNLDLIMGVELRVVYDFINVIHGEANLNQALIKDRHTDNLYILPASQTRDKDALTYHGVGKVMQELSDMGFEYIICDSPAGIEAGALIALYYADEAIVTTNPEVSSVRDSDRIIGILNARSRRAEQNLEPVRPKLLLTRYVPERVEKKEMLSTDDIQELLSIPLLGIIPESPDVLKASNAGVTIILDKESEAGQAYQDAVDRLLGEEVPLRFLQVKKKGFLAKLFGGN